MTTLEAVVGFVPNAAVTPLGRPDAARVTVPVNPPVSVTAIVSVPELPCAMDTLLGEGPRVKPAPVPVTVMVNISLLMQEDVLVKVATNVSAPTVSGIALTWRVVEVKPPGPVQLQLPPVVGCGPRLTVAPEATVAMLV